MQQAPFAWSGYPSGSLKQKHRLDEVDDTDHIRAAAGQATAAGPYEHGVKFSQSNLEAVNAFVAANKRRKGNAGQVALPPDLEPQFESLSLRSGQPQQSTPAVSETPSISAGTGAFREPVIDLPERGRLPGYPYLETTRGRRDGTPTVSLTGSSGSSHRRRSSSRNRARKTSSSSDTDMKPAPRYDPARPHVVFVDSLSDSDEEETDQTSEAELTGIISELSTPGNSPSSSDTEDGAIKPYRDGIRPIQMNKRLRDHLRKQAMMQRLGHKPPTEGLLANAPPTTGGAGIREHALVLYRPLSWGIVEEPDEDDSDATTRGSTPAFSDEVKIQELPADGGIPQEDAILEAGQSDLDAMEVDQDMELD